RKEAGPAETFASRTRPPPWARRAKSTRRELGDGGFPARSRDGLEPVGVRSGEPRPFLHQPSPPGQPAATTLLPTRKRGTAMAVPSDWLVHDAGLVLDGARAAGVRRRLALWHRDRGGRFSLDGPDTAMIWSGGRAIPNAEPVAAFTMRAVGRQVL